MPDDSLDSDDLLALLAPSEVTSRPAPLPKTPPAPGSRRAGRSVAEVPAVEPSSVDLPSPLPSAPGSPSAVSAPVAVGRRFHPVPGAPLVGPGGLVAADPGTPVHAIAAGRVELTTGMLKLIADDGLMLGYEGVVPTSALASGDRVAAGAVLGVVSGSAGQPTTLRLRARDDAGADLDAAAVLLGLADPDELGYLAVGTGAGVDPDVLDRELAEEVGP